ncbi:Fc.00g096960.m01.CDS01 [Cosmosporella sp. VM-42]
MSLDHLAPELLSLILQAIDSPADLHRLISASPSCFRTFSRSPQLILSSVVRNALPTDNLEQALAILQAPSTKTEVPSFLDKYFNSPSSFDFPKNKADLLILFRLYNRLSYLVDGYFRRIMQELSCPGQQPRADRAYVQASSFVDGSLRSTMQKLSCPGKRPRAHQAQAQDANDRDEGRGENKDETSPTASVVPPSLSERIRLQRAFLRFELYCKVFPGHESDPYGLDQPPPQGHPADQQFSLFLANVTPWEVEEMCCVEQYFSSLVEAFIDELEEDLINAVMVAPGVVLPSTLRTSQSSAEEESSQEKSTQDDLIDFKSLDLTDLMLFCGDGRRSSPRYISYMTSLGQDFMYSLTKSEKPKRTQLIRSNHPVTREFLREALGYALRRTTGREHDIPTAEHDMGDDDPTRSNIGYRLFRNAPDNVIYMGISDSGSEYSPLRQLGYVFWDTKRIKSPEVSKKLLAAKTMGLDELEVRFGRRYRKTAEDRLKGTKLPREQMQRLEEEFGSTLLGDYDD